MLWMRSVMQRLSARLARVANNNQAGASVRANDRVKKLHHEVLHAKFLGDFVTHPFGIFCAVAMLDAHHVVVVDFAVSFFEMLYQCLQALFASAFFPCGASGSIEN